MTNAILSYNPILMKSEFAINGEEIAKTSNLYRYRNTPIEDWIDVFIPELIEYCNDDKVSIEIRSLQKYIDDVKNKIDDYCKTHRVVITVLESPSIGYKGRINKIKNILVELGEVSLLPQEAEDLSIVVASSAEKEDHEEFLKDFLNTEDITTDKGFYVSELSAGEEFEKLDIELPWINDRNVRVKLILFPNLIDCDNRYWLSLKDIVSDEKDYMFIAVLNRDRNKNDELIDYIAEQYDKKGKLNRSRFILLSSNPQDNVNYLRDEYGMKVSRIFDFDEASECHVAIQYYIQNISYPKKINFLYSEIKTILETKQSDIARRTEIRKSVEELDFQRIYFEQECDKIKEHYSSLILKNSSDGDIIDRFIQTVTDNIVVFIIEEAKLTAKKITPTSSINYFTRMLNTHLNFIEIEKAPQISKIAGETLCELIINHYTTNVITCANKTILDLGIKLGTEYEVLPFVEENIRHECFKFTNEISEMKKNSEDGSKIRFFEWITENTTILDFGKISDNFLSSGNGEKSYEAKKKIKRRIKKIETQIKDFLTSIDLSVYDVLGQKKEKIELLIEESRERFISKCDNLEKQLVISDSDKSQIETLSELIDDINTAIEL